MRRRLLDAAVPTRSSLERDDFVGAIGIFLLVVIATSPVVVPFLLTSDITLAMNLSRGLTLVMLFVAGVALGRHAGRADRPVPASRWWCWAPY